MSTKEFIQINSGAKKFLYTGAKSKEPSDEDRLFFTPRSTNVQSGTSIDLDGVWSIKKNVGIGATQQNKLNLNANKTFYSRHGGMKDTSTSETTGTVGDGNWTPSKRSYSYSYGNDQGQSSQDIGQTGKWDKDDYNF